MRFTKKKDMMNKYYSNARKTETKFLWWPVTIDNETRWLETATIEYRVAVNSGYGLIPNEYYYWQPLSFINE